MAGDVEVTGLDNLVKVSRALKAAGDEGKGLRKELYAGLNRATKPIRADLNAEVGPSFPHGGGLADLMAKRAKFAVSTRTGAATTGVRLVARGKSRGTLRSALTTGTIRHPVYGNRSAWVNQSKGVTQGLIQEAFDRDVPEAKHEVLKAIENVRDQIYRRS